MRVLYAPYTHATKGLADAVNGRGAGGLGSFTLRRGDFIEVSRAEAS